MWERDLPRGVKSKDRTYQMGEAATAGDDRSNWLSSSHQTFSAQGLPFCQTVGNRDMMLTKAGMDALEQHRNRKTYDDYFTLGGDQQQQEQPQTYTYASLTSRQSSGKSSNGGKRPLTNPIMSRRMEHIYQIGRLKAITR